MKSQYRPWIEAETKALRSYSACNLRDIGRAELLILVLERSRVDAVSLVRRPGTVVKYVPEVRIAFGAENLGATHEEAPVRFSADVFARHRFGEAGPARAGIKFGVGIE